MTTHFVRLHSQPTISDEPNDIVRQFPWSTYRHLSTQAEIYFLGWCSLNYRYKTTYWVCSLQLFAWPFSSPLDRYLTQGGTSWARNCQARRGALLRPCSSLEAVALHRSARWVSGKVPNNQARPERMAVTIILMPPSHPPTTLTPRRRRLFQVALHVGPCVTCLAIGPLGPHLPIASTTTRLSSILVWCVVSIDIRSSRSIAMASLS